MSDEPDAREKLFLGLADARWRFDADKDEWRRVLLKALLDYCKAVGFDREALDPLQQLLFEQVSWEGRKPLSEVAAMSLAAAAVTTLSQRADGQSVKDTLKEVSRTSGIDEQKLAVFRNNLSSATRSKNLNPKTVEYYRLYRARIREWPTPDIWESVSKLGRFVR